MKTSKQMMNAPVKHIAKRPAVMGAQPSGTKTPSGRAATDGTAKIQNTPQNIYNVNAKAKNNTKPGVPGKLAKVDGTAGNQGY